MTMMVVSPSRSPTWGTSPSTPRFPEHTQVLITSYHHTFFAICAMGFTAAWIRMIEFPVLEKSAAAMRLKFDWGMICIYKLLKMWVFHLLIHHKHHRRNKVHHDHDQHCIIHLGNWEAVESHPSSQGRLWRDCCSQRGHFFGPVSKYLNICYHCTMGPLQNGVKNCQLWLIIFP